MQKAFEKIIEKVKAYYDAVNPYVGNTVTKIVNQVAEEYRSTEHINCSTGDLIRRSALIKALTNVEVSYYLENGQTSDTYDGTTIMDIIEEQPTVSVNDGWIPCSERLPKKDDRYLVCTKSPTNYYNVTTSYFTNDLYDFDKYAFGRYKGKQKASFCDFNSECGYYEVSNIIAWQLLPQPYVKGE